MDNALSHAMAAKEHAEDAARQLNQIVNSLKESLSYLVGTEEDAVSQAAIHLSRVAEVVGSTTAENLSNTYREIGDKIKDTPTGGISQAIDTLEPLIGWLVELGNQTEQLAAQLGA